MSDSFSSDQHSKEAVQFLLEITQVLFWQMSLIVNHHTFYFFNIFLANFTTFCRESNWMFVLNATHRQSEIQFLSCRF